MGGSGYRLGVEVGLHGVIPVLRRLHVHLLEGIASRPHRAAHRHVGDVPCLVGHGRGGGVPALFRNVQPAMTYEEYLQACEPPDVDALDRRQAELLERIEFVLMMRVRGHLFTG